MPTYSYRITYEGVKQLEADLKAIGPTGAQAFERVKQAIPGLADGLARAEQHIKRTKDEGRRAAEEGVNLGRAFQQAGREISIFAGQAGAVGRVIGALGPIGIAAAAALGTVVAATAGVARAGDQLRPLQGALVNLTGSNAAAAASFDLVYASAQRVGVGLVESLSTFGRYARAAEELGRSQPEIARFAETVQKLAAIGGASTQEAAAGAIQLSQGLASGRLQGEELRSVLENMPPVAKAIARELGVSVGALRDLAKEGALTADVILPAILKQSAQADQEFENVGNTMGRAWTRMLNAATAFGAKLDEFSGISRLLADYWNTVAEKIDKARGAVARATTSDPFAERADLLAYAVPTRRDPRGSIGAFGDELARRDAEIAESAARSYEDYARAMQKAAEVRDNAAATQIAAANELLGSVDQQATAETKLIRIGTDLAKQYAIITEQVERQGFATEAQVRTLEALQRAAGLVTKEYDNLIAKQSDYIASARLAAQAAERLARVAPGDERGRIVAEVENQVAQKRAELEKDARLDPTERAAQLAEYRRELLRTAEAQRQARIAQASYDAQREAGARIAEQLTDAEVKANEELRRMNEARDKAWSDYRFETKTLEEQARVAAGLPVVWNELTESYEVNTHALRVLIETQKLEREQFDRDPEAIRKEAERRVAAAEAIEKVGQVQEKLARDANRNAELMAEPFKNALRGIQTSFADVFTKVFDGGIDSFKDLAQGIKGIFTRLAGEIAALLVFRPVVGGILGAVGAGGLASSLGLGRVGGIGGGLGNVPVVSGINGGGYSLGDLLGLGKMFGGGGITSAIDSFGASVFGLAGGAGAVSPAIASELGALGIDAGIGAGGLGATGVLGGTTLSQVLGVGGGILSIGTGILSLTKGNTIGGVSGILGGGLAALGALVPSLSALGPIGLGIGLVGGLLGGLFGKKQKTPRASAYFALGSEGNFALTSTDQRKGGPLAAVQQAGGDVGSLITDIVLGLGGEFADYAPGYYTRAKTPKSGARSYIGYIEASGGLREMFNAQNAQGFEQIGTAFTIEYLQRGLREGYITGLDANVAKAIQATANNPRGYISGNTTDLEAFTRNIEFAQTFDATIRQLNRGVRDFAEDAVHQARAEVGSIVTAFREFIKTTRDLTLDVEAAEQAQRAYVEILFGIRDAAEPISATAAAWEALKAKFDEAAPLFKEVGLDVGQIPALLAQAQAKFVADFNETVARDIRAITDPLGLALDDLARVQEQRLADAAKIGADLVQIEKLNALERAEVIAQSAGSSLRDLAERLRGAVLGVEQGSLSPLSSAEKLASAQDAYETALASGSPADMAKLPELAAAYLELAKQQYAFGPQYAAIFETVRTDLTDVAASIEAVLGGTGSLASVFTTYAETNNRQMVDLIEEVRRMRIEAAARDQQIADLIDQLARLRAGELV